MDTVLNEVFDQAAKLLAEVDRRAAEERDRRLAAERQAKLDVFGAAIEQAFDFSSREKIELNTRLDLHDGRPALEFMVRTARAVFALHRQDDPSGRWQLEVQDTDAAPVLLGTFQSGLPDRAAHEDGSRRIAAVRVVVAIGRWIEEHTARDRQPVRETQTPAPYPSEPAERRESRRLDPEPPAEPLPQTPNRDVSYGTFGKFMGY